MNLLKGQKYLTKEQQIKRAFLKGLLVSIIICAIIILIYQVIVIPVVKRIEKNHVLAEIEAARDKEIKVWALKSDVNQGSNISNDSIQLCSRSANELPKDAVTDKNIILGKVARMSLKAKTVLTQSMVTDLDDVVTPDLRKQDFSYIILNKDLKKGDYIDVRIKMNDGSDFIVMSKKLVYNINGQTIFSRITEDERTYLNNATVAASIKNATLYTSIYPDPQNQPKAEITYQLDKDVAKLIENNSNAVKNAEDKIRDRNNSTQNNTSEGNNQAANTINNDRPSSLGGN